MIFLFFKYFLSSKIEIFVLQVVFVFVKSQCEGGSCVHGFNQRQSWQRSKQMKMPELDLFEAARGHCKGARILLGRGPAGGEQGAGAGGQEQGPRDQEYGDKEDKE